MSNDARPSMKQIGDAAGVSKSAVSLALKNDPRIPEETRTRIQKVAEEMGYRRNPLVDSLMTQLRVGRQQAFKANLCLINCSASEDLMVNPSFRSMRDGTLRQAKDLGYGVEEFWLNQPNMKAAQLKDIITARGIRGVILIGARNKETITDFVDVLGDEFAISVIGVTPLKERLNSASNNHYSTIRNAMDKIFELGYQRPMLLIPRSTNSLLEDKFSSGYYSACRRLDTSNRLDMFEIDTSDYSSAVNAIQEFRPDVVLTDQSALYESMISSGIKIPEEIAYVNLDLHGEKGDVSGMYQNNHIVGSAGVDLVVGQLHKYEFGLQEFAKVVLIESSWSMGSTVVDLKVIH